jgi:hypothetical protein
MAGGAALVGLAGLGLIAAGTPMLDNPSQDLPELLGVATGGPPANAPPGAAIS